MAMTTRTFAVRGMTCTHCQAAVVKALRGVSGVAAAEVDLDRAEAQVGYDPAKVTVQQLERAVEDAGYTLVPA